MPFTSNGVYACMAFSITARCALHLPKQRAETISCFMSHQPDPNRIVHGLTLTADLKSGIDHQIKHRAG